MKLLLSFVFLNLCHLGIVSAAEESMTEKVAFISKILNNPTSICKFDIDIEYKSLGFTFNSTANADNPNSECVTSFNLFPASGYFEVEFPTVDDFGKFLNAVYSKLQLTSAYRAEVSGWYKVVSSY